MSTQNAAARSAHPIQVAARRSGLTADLIRAWERRYGAVTPGRTATNRRVYTDEDIEKLLLLGQVIQAGRRIGDVASLNVKQLRSMVSEDRNAAARVSPKSARDSGSAPARQHLENCLAALHELDAAGLESALGDASVDLPAPALLEHLLVPFMRTIGERWQSGELRVAHEHVATAIVRTYLGAMKKTAPASPSGPELIVAAPAGQSHELGGLSVAVAAAADGWRVTYLGADLPADEIAAVAKPKQAKVVALSLVYPADDARLPEELRTLRARLAPETVLIVGGPAAAAYREVLDEIGAVVIPDIATLRAELRTLRYRAPSA